MNIILESSALLHPKTGIGRYNFELAKGLQKVDNIEQLEFIVRNNLYKELKDIEKLAFKGKQSYPILTKPLRMVRNYINKRRSSKQCKRSLVHGSNYFLPECAEGGVITVHDLSIYRYPETHPKERIIEFDKHFSNTLKRTSHIITDSEAMRKEITKYLGWAENKISVVYLGVSQKFTPKSESNTAFLSKYNLKNSGYTLCVSTIEPRKNIDKLLDVYRCLDDSIRKHYPLVLIGGDGWLYETIMPKIEKGIEEGWLIKPGFVPEVDLYEFYSHARLFIYPSEYEGFGLPVAEAMATGIPVVISNRTSLPEVADGAALVIEPNDAVMFMTAILQGLTDEEWRTEAAIAGIEVAKRYNWNSCVADTVSVYQKVLEGR